MFKRSWFYQNGLFYTILALVLLIHLCLLAIRLYKDLDLANVSTPESSQTRAPLKVKIIRPEVKIKKQIVQSDDSDSNKKPKDNSYLSDKDRKFDRESVARKIDTFKSSGKGEVAKEKLSLSELGAFEKGHNPLKAAAKSAKAGTKSGNEKKSGVSSTNDYVEQVHLGDLTYLNTIEYKYYGFYHRIRQKLEQFWGRSIQEKAQDFNKQGRKIASEDNLMTSLQVTLNELGEVVEVAIKNTSGVKELDDAAVESFNQAGPFPNPPKGLLENGLVKIEWGFVVKT